MPFAVLLARRNKLRGDYESLKHAVKQRLLPDQAILDSATEVLRPDIDTEHTNEGAILQQQIDWLRYKLYLVATDYARGDFTDG